MSSDINGKTQSDWEKTYVDHLTYSINLFLVTATGALGFCISQVISLPNSNYSSSFRTAVAYLFVSILAGAFCTIMRLVLFGIRKSLTSTNKILYYIVGNGKLVEGLLETGVFLTFVGQIIAFVIGIIPLGLQLVAAGANPWWPLFIKPIGS